MKINNMLLLLSGTPASGKDTITNILTQRNPRFSHFRKHRSGDKPGLGVGYIHVTDEEFTSMSAKGEFLQSHYRYGRGYGVAHSELIKHWVKGDIPIVHVGQYRNIGDLSTLRSKGIVTVSILLLVSLQETCRRLLLRHPGNPAEVDERLKAYKEERADLAALVRSGQALEFDLVCDNSHNRPHDVATLIANFCTTRATLHT